jgi:hypothetical protein
MLNKNMQLETNEADQRAQALLMAVSPPALVLWYANTVGMAM